MCPKEMQKCGVWEAGRVSRRGDDFFEGMERDSLSGVRLVVHEQHVHIRRVVDEEDLMAGRSKVSSSFVAAVSDLYYRGHIRISISYNFFSPFF